MNKSKGRGLVDFSKRYHRRNMWENITLEIWELLDWEALIPTIPSVAWTSGGLMDSDRSISCRPSVTTRHGGDAPLWSAAVLKHLGGRDRLQSARGPQEQEKKEEEERQNEKRRPALMQRRGSAGYYEFFRNLKDSSKAWLSVHTRVCECVCWGAGVHVRATLWSVSRLREGPSVGMIYY